MNDEQIALAKRAVACKGWRWMPGTRTTEGMRVIHDPGLWPDRPCAIREGTWVDTAVPRPLGDHLPDLTDPATLGCLLALVREATTAYASLTFEPGYLHTEVENLVAALEAGPGQ
jgi:hypothetical protein